MHRKPALPLSSNETASLRNIFDQYRHPENRLTHALACSLGADAELLRAFIFRSLGAQVAIPKILHVVEQRLPGEAELSEDEAERRGLPDAWIYSSDGWSLLIESKLASKTDVDQINRHLRTAERRGFTNCNLVVLSLDTPNQLPKRAFHMSWAELYEWAGTQKSRSEWAVRLTNYMEVAERRMLTDSYLLEGTLTAFSGINFDAQNPYSYFEGKRLLKLLTENLRKSTILKDQLGMNPLGAGRGAITGQDTDHVWDFLPLQKAAGAISFTRVPHLTLSIARDNVVAQVTVPNLISGDLRRNLVGRKYDGFKDIVNAFIQQSDVLLEKDSGAAPFVKIVQRHYLSQRSDPTIDAILQFDPRTAGKSTSLVKMQEEWLRAAFDAFSKPKSNLQLQFGFVFPYKTSTTVSKASFAQVVEQAWLACKPILISMGL